MLKKSSFVLISHCRVSSTIRKNSWSTNFVNPNNYKFGLFSKNTTKIIHYILQENTPEIFQQIISQFSSSTSVLFWFLLQRLQEHGGAERLGKREQPPRLGAAGGGAAPAADPGAAARRQPGGAVRLGERRLDAVAARQSAPAARAQPLADLAVPALAPPLLHQVQGVHVRAQAHHRRLQRQPLAAQGRLQADFQVCKVRVTYCTILKFLTAENVHFEVVYTRSQV
jgi:hypothetical protein